MTEWGTKAPDSSLSGPVMRFQMANSAVASRLRTAGYEKRSPGAHKWMLPQPLFVIKRPTVPWVGLGALMAETCESLSASPAAVTHTSPHTPPTRSTGAIFRRPTEISISAWMNLWAKHCVSHCSLSSLFSLPARVSVSKVHCVVSQW